jgi:NADH-quinone oxidoreductase subunit J
MHSWAMILSGAAACLFAVLMALQRSLYSAALCLLAVIFLAAGMFFLSGAPLVAFLQVMIYAGAVMVLIVVTIMASAGTSPRFADLAAPKPLAVLAGLVFAGELLSLALRAPAASAAAAVDLQGKVGAALFSTYAVATEAVTLLLFLAALAVLDARRVR